MPERYIPFSRTPKKFEALASRVGTCKIVLYVFQSTLFSHVSALPFFFPRVSLLGVPYCITPPSIVYSASVAQTLWIYACSGVKPGGCCRRTDSTPPLGPARLATKQSVSAVLSWSEHAAHGSASCARALRVLGIGVTTAPP